jgi:hypothetical protein
MLSWGCGAASNETGGPEGTDGAPATDAASSDSPHPGADGGDASIAAHADGAAVADARTDATEAADDAASADASTPVDGGGPATPPPLDCGPIGVAVVNAGPPKNRVNYVILGDGYTSTTVDTTLMTHIDNAMTERFTPELGQPYLRYKNFVNICLLKTVSPTDGIGNGPTIFSCTGDDKSRLATCDTTTAQQVLDANTPAGMTVDWHAIVLNGDHWWNTGSPWMLWSGGNASGPKAALHEGGHGFHQFADEYCASATGSTCGPNGGGPNGTEYQEVNSTGNGTTSTDKWPAWLGVTQKGMAVPDRGVTGVQGLFVGSRYVDTGQYRPSSNSKMNSLFGDTVDTSFNAVSREKMVMDIWRFVTPVDSADPPAGAVSGTPQLTVHVIDPAVIDVDWSVDGAVVAAHGGATFDVSTKGLASGSHVVAAKAYDNATTDLVRQVPGTTWGRMNWTRSVQTVTWTVTVP